MFPTLRFHGQTIWPHLSTPIWAQTCNTIMLQTHKSPGPTIWLPQLRPTCRLRAVATTLPTLRYHGPMTWLLLWMQTWVPTWITTISQTHRSHGPTTWLHQLTRTWPQTTRTTTFRELRLRLITQALCSTTSQSSLRLAGTQWKSYPREKAQCLTHPDLCSECWLSTDRLLSAGKLPIFYI